MDGDEKLVAILLCAVAVCVIAAASCQARFQESTDKREVEMAKAGLSQDSQGHWVKK